MTQIIQLQDHGTRWESDLQRVRLKHRPRLKSYLESARHRFTCLCGPWSRHGTPELLYLISLLNSSQRPIVSFRREQHALVSH